QAARLAGAGRVEVRTCCALSSMLVVVRLVVACHPALHLLLAWPAPCGRAFAPPGEGGVCGRSGVCVRGCAPARTPRPCPRRAGTGKGRGEGLPGCPPVPAPLLPGGSGRASVMAPLAEPSPMRGIVGVEPDGHQRLAVQRVVVGHRGFTAPADAAQPVPHGHPDAEALPVPPAVPLLRSGASPGTQVPVGPGPAGRAGRLAGP